MTDTISPPRTPDSTPATEKPEKPYPDFPLFWHGRGYWCKKFKGKQIPLGADASDALRKWTRIEAGVMVKRRNTPKAATVRDIYNRFVAEQRERLADGEIGPVIFAMYRREGATFGDGVGWNRAADTLTKSDFAERRRVALRRGTRALDRHIISVRAMFNWAMDEAELIDRLPRYGRAFKKTSAKMRRHAKNRARDVNGESSWTAKELRQLIGKADAIMKAAILLAINGGMGSGDLSALCKRHIDRKAKMIHLPRPKTGIDRWIPLWPETLKAIDAAIAVRPKPRTPDLADHAFLTETGRLVARDVIKEDEGGITKTTRVDRIGNRFNELIGTLKLKRAGRGFYSLRSAFRSLAVGQPPELVKLIMGHQLVGRDEDYVRGVLHDLRSVVNHVHARVWAA